MNKPKNTPHDAFRNWLDTVDLATGSGIAPAPTWDEELPDLEDDESDDAPTPVSHERRPQKPARYR